MNNLHLYFQPQLEEIVDDLIFVGHDMATLQDIMSKSDWQRATPFQDIKLRFNRAFHSLDDWIALHGLIEGDYKPFKANLELQLSTTIEARWEIHMRHMQEDLMANHEIELGVSA